MRRSVLALALALALATPATACGVGSKVAHVLESLPAASASVTMGPSVSPSIPPSPGTKPAIVVKAPRPQEEIVSPVTVSGTAEVFEGTVTIRLLDADGNELAAMRTQASCGTGCRGTFSVKLAFFTPRWQTGTVQVYGASAQDGSAVGVVEIPVALVPGG